VKYVLPGVILIHYCINFGEKSESSQFENRKGGFVVFETTRVISLIY
jgi:hypothetical protein